METIILEREDFKSEEDGYHLCMFNSLVDMFNLPSDTYQIELAVKLLKSDTES